MLDSQTAVIVVDVNKAKMTECPALLDICRTIIVFDQSQAVKRAYYRGSLVIC